MKITDEARDVLFEVLKENNKSGIRIYFAGFGWGGPNIGLALDEPQSEDKVVFINKIQVSFDPDLEDYTKDFTLEYDKYREGLVMLGNNDGC